MRAKAREREREKGLIIIAKTSFSGQARFIFLAAVVVVLLQHTSSGLLKIQAKLTTTSININYSQPEGKTYRAGGGREEGNAQIVCSPFSLRCEPRSRENHFLALLQRENEQHEKYNLYRFIFMNGESQQGQTA